MANATTLEAAPARRHPGLPQVSIEDVPFPIISRIIQRAREGTQGKRFLTYAIVSSSWLDASLDSVRAAFLRGEDIDAVMAGALDRFQDLTCVCLEGCQGQELPAELGLRLPRVEALKLKDCPNLTALPGSIGEMVSLKKLSLHGLEQLASLPPSLLRVTTLETVAIWKCHRLEENPEEMFAALTGVKHLNLHVSTSEMLDSIQDLPHLETLVMTVDEVHTGGRQVTLSGFHSLRSLKRVSIRRIPSDDMPPAGAISLWEPLIDPIEVSLAPTMSTMHQLKHLDLRGLSTECVPELLGRLPLLQSLFLQCSCLTSLPPGFPSLQHLTLKVHHDVASGFSYFFARRNSPLDYGSLPRGNYPSLKHLTIFGKFKILPPVICDLTTLETLVVSAPVEELPSTIGRVGQLRTLELVNCRQLSSIPQSITSIKTLEALTCSSKECEFPLSPEWDLKLLDLSRAIVPVIKCPVGSVAVKELRLSCDYESNTYILSTHSAKLFRGVQVLKVTHCGDRSYCDYREWDERHKEYTGWLSQFLTCMTDPQVLDLSEAPCVHDLSKCFGLGSIRALKLSPDWPQGLHNRRFETICDVLDLQDLPNLGKGDRAKLRARCRNVLQADLLRLHEHAAEIQDSIMQHEEELDSLEE